MTDNTKARSRKANKRNKVAVEVQHKRNTNRHHAKRRRNQDNQRRMTVGGLFVRLLKERGFVRTTSRTDRTVFAKETGDGQTHTVTMDYIPGQAALLVVYDGDTEVVQHVLYYREQPVPEATRKALAPKRKQAGKPKGGKVVPQWKRELAEFNRSVTGGQQ